MEDGGDSRGGDSRGPVTRADLEHFKESLLEEMRLQFDQMKKEFFLRKSAVDERSALFACATCHNSRALLSPTPPFFFFFLDSVRFELAMPLHNQELQMELAKTAATDA